MTSFLLDTHVLLWAARDRDRLSGTTRSLLADRTADVLFSVVNLWEMTIKNALGRRGFSVDVGGLRGAALSAGYRELSVDAAHVLRLTELPPVHNDPFDRMLLAQARAERLTLLTADRQVLAYGEPAQQA